MDIFKNPALVQAALKREKEAENMAIAQNDILSQIGFNARQAGGNIGNSIANIMGRPQQEDPRLAAVKKIHEQVKGIDVKSPEGIRQYAQVIAPFDPVKAIEMVSIADKMSATPERKTIKGKDGYNYYLDTKERVLPGIEEEEKREIKADVNGYLRYTDDGSRVYPGVNKDTGDDKAFSPIQIVDENDNVVATVDANKPKVVEGWLSQGYRAMRTVSNQSVGPTPSQIAKSQTELEGRFHSVNSLVGSVNGLIKDMEQNPLAGTIAGGFGQFADSLIFNTQGIIDTVKQNDSKSLEDYDNAFTRYGISNSAMRSRILDLAYLAAAARGQEGKGASDRDIKIFAEIATGKGSPKARIAAATSFAERMVEEFNTVYSYEKSKGKLDLNKMTVQDIYKPSTSDDEFEKAAAKYE